jgi:hypothetical protein
VIGGGGLGVSSSEEEDEYEEVGGEAFPDIVTIEKINLQNVHIVRVCVHSATTIVHWREMLSL